MAVVFIIVSWSSSYKIKYGLSNKLCQFKKYSYSSPREYCAPLLIISRMKLCNQQNSSDATQLEGSVSEDIKSSDNVPGQREKRAQWSNSKLNTQTKKSLRRGGVKRWTGRDSAQGRSSCFWLQKLYIQSSIAWVGTDIALSSDRQEALLYFPYMREYCK